MYEFAGKDDWNALNAAIDTEELVAKARAKAIALGLDVSQIKPEFLALAIERMEKEQSMAQQTIRKGWTRSHGRKILLQRCEDRIRRKQEAASSSIARSYKSSRVRWGVNEKCRVSREKRMDKAARVMQRAVRWHFWMRILTDKFRVRKLLQEQERRYLEMVAAATQLVRWYKAVMAFYNAPLRIVARYRITSHVRKAKAAAEAAERDAAARQLQKGWRRRQQRIYLINRFMNRGARLEAMREMQQNEAAARVLQQWARNVFTRCYLRSRFATRAKLLLVQEEKEAREALELASATIIQRCYRKHASWEVMRIRFGLRAKTIQERVAAEEARKQMRDKYEASHAALEEQRRAEGLEWEMKLQLEEERRKRKEDEAASHLLAAWKLGWDDQAGGNIWFNHVTGETVTTAPDGWELKPSEQYLKQENENGVTFYLNQMTGKSCWFPPCEICTVREGAKVCMDCNDIIYCERCFNKSHKPRDNPQHRWRGATSTKDELSAGEIFCCECDARKAEFHCLDCHDCFCQRCLKKTHGSGNRRHHQIDSYENFKKGWQKIEGRTSGELTYYFNGTTGESTYDKPEALMLKAEREEHAKFLEHKEAAEKYVKKVEKLQLQLEQVMYDKDKLAYEYEQLQQNGGGQEVDEKGKPITAEEKASREKEAQYRKGLLMSRGQKKAAGFDIKLKPSFKK
ncbi:unnamed protein product [Chrysoparadoxa australica]